MEGLEKLHDAINAGRTMLRSTLISLERGEIIDDKRILNIVNVLNSKLESLLYEDTHSRDALKTEVSKHLEEVAKSYRDIRSLVVDTRFTAPEKRKIIEMQLGVLDRVLDKLVAIAPNFDEHQPTILYFLNNIQPWPNCKFNTPDTLGYSVAKEAIIKLKNAGFKVVSASIFDYKINDPVTRDLMVQLPISNLSTDLQNDPRNVLSVEELSPEDLNVFLNACIDACKSDPLFANKNGDYKVHRGTKVYKLDGKLHYILPAQASLAEFSDQERMELKACIGKFTINHGREMVAFMLPLGNSADSFLHLHRNIYKDPSLKLITGNRNKTFVFTNNVTADQAAFSELNINNAIADHKGVSQMEKNQLLHHNTNIVSINIPEHSVPIEYPTKYQIIDDAILEEKSTVLASVISGVLTGKIKKNNIHKNLNKSPDSLVMYSPEKKAPTVPRTELTQDEIATLRKWAHHIGTFIDNYLELENPDKEAILEYMTACALGMAVCVNALEFDGYADVSKMKQSLEKFTEFYYATAKDSKKRVQLCMGLDDDYFRQTSALIRNGSKEDIRDAILHGETTMSAAVDGHSLMAFIQLFLQNKFRIKDFGPSITSFADINRLIGHVCGVIKERQQDGELPRKSIPAQNRNTWLKMAAHGAFATIPKENHVDYLNKTIDIAKNDMAISIKYEDRKPYPEEQLKQAMDTVHQLEKDGINITAGFESEVKIAARDASPKYLELIKIKEAIGRFRGEAYTHNHIRSYTLGENIRLPDVNIREVFDDSERGYIGDPWYDSILSEINKDIRAKLEALDISVFKEIKDDMLGEIDLVGVKNKIDVLLMSPSQLADFIVKNMSVLTPSEIFLYFLTQIHNDDLKTIPEGGEGEQLQDLCTFVSVAMDGALYAGTQYGVEYISMPAKLSEFKDFFKKHMNLKQNILRRLNLTELGEGGLQFSISATDANGKIINRFHRDGTKLEVDAITMPILQIAIDSMKAHLERSNVSRLPNFNPKGIITGVDKCTSVKFDHPYQFYHLNYDHGNQTGRDGGLRLHGIGKNASTRVPLVLEMRAVGGYRANENHICDPISEPNGKIKPFLSMHDNYADLLTFIDSLVINSANAAQDLRSSVEGMKTIEVPPNHYGLISPILVKQKEHSDDLTITNLSRIESDQMANLPKFRSRKAKVGSQHRESSVDRVWQSLSSEDSKLLRRVSSARRAGGRAM